MLKIVKDDQESLHEKCEKVESPLSQKDKDTLMKMLDYLKKSQDDEYAKKHHIRSGVGLAAPQIGINKRMFVVYFVDEEEKVHEYALVNPRIVSNSVKLAALKNGEGCLSVDKDHEGLVYRSAKVTFEAFDLLKNKIITFTVRDYEAIVLQHEYDHLDGILYYDRISKTNPFEQKPNSILI